MMKPPNLACVLFALLLLVCGIAEAIPRPSQDFPVQLYLSGPAEIDRGLTLHLPDDMGAGTRQLGKGVALSTGPDVLQALAEGNGPKQSRLVLGYAGWSPGQLDHELARGDRLVAPADPSLIFSDDPDEVWGKALLHAGISL
ncbi:YqgE/AlgH family protein [Candidatus Methylospira mobilis]|nr:YqgE/AlgH family protein [Candidatus Methylospira mobilis]WNV04680.1 YqgE/AlgH family protein [Candidatus Methylospira mobilis]